MKKRILHVVFALVILVAAICLFLSDKDEQGLSQDSHKTASYAIDGTWIRLGTDGTAYLGNEATGDLDGDGREDTAFIFTREPGGSGTFYYIAAALADGESYVGTNAMLLGDRIAPQNLSIQEGDVVVTFAERKSDEPMSTPPSHGVTSYYKIDGGKLIYQGSR
jgi:hypothetical protein